MRPINFKESNKLLSKPEDMTDEECSSLHVFNNNVHSISCWEGTWKERLKFLFTGKIWLSVISGKTQPPVYTTIDSPFVKPNSKFFKQWLVENYEKVKL